MADNNDDAVDGNDDAAVAEEDEDMDYSYSDVETKIERLKSDNPKETLFEITFDKYVDLPSEKGQAVYSSEFSCFGSQWQVSICDSMAIIDLSRWSLCHYFLRGAQKAKNCH